MLLLFSGTTAVLTICGVIVLALLDTILAEVGIPFALMNEAVLPIGVLCTSFAGLLSLQHWNRMAKMARTRMVPPTTNSIVPTGSVLTLSVVARCYN